MSLAHLWPSLRQLGTKISDQFAAAVRLTI